MATVFDDYEETVFDSEVPDNSQVVEPATRPAAPRSMTVTPSETPSAKPSFIDEALSVFDGTKAKKRSMTVTPSVVSQPQQPPMTGPLAKATALIKTIASVPENLMASVIKATQGTSGASITGQDVGDKIVEWVERNNQKLSQEYGDKGFISERDIAELGPNLGFSGVSMASGIAGGAAGSLIPGPGTIVGSMAASGISAYRMQTYSTMMNWLTKVNEESIQQTGKPITPEEEKKFKERFDKLASESGLWEAGPEAVGNVLEIALMAGKGTLPGRLASLLPKGVAGKAVKGIGRAAGIVGTEEATETITQHGQHNVEVNTGMSKEPVRKWTSGDDILKSAEEVLPGVLMLSGFMTAGGAVYRKASGKAKERKLSKPEELISEPTVFDNVEVKDNAVKEGEKPDGNIAEHQGTGGEGPETGAEPIGKAEEAPKVDPRRIIDDILKDLDEVQGQKAEIEKAKDSGITVSHEKEAEVEQKADELKTELAEAVQEDRKPTWEKKDGLITYDDVKDTPYADIISNVPAWRMKLSDYKAIPKKKGIGIQKKDGVLWAQSHKNAVEEAAASGETIPDEVLEDYGYLKKKDDETLPAPLSQTDAATVGKEADAKIGEASPDFNEMVKEAQRWKGAAYKVDAALGDDKKARLAHSQRTTKADLDAYLMNKFGVDASTARNVSNELTAKNLKPDETANVEDFAGEPWANVTVAPKSEANGKVEAAGEPTASELKKTKKKQKPTMMENAPPGGWTEADKVPTQTPAPRDMKREAAITKYRVHILESNPKTGSEFTDKIVALIDARDGIGLRRWMNGINPKINRLFTDLTGLPAKTKKEADASLRSLDPGKWDKWQEDKKTEGERADAERSAARKKDIEDRILDERVRYNGKEELTRRELYQRKVDEGYVIEKEKRGAVPVYQLVEKEKGTTLKIPSAIVDRIQLLINERAGKINTPEPKINTPEPEGMSETPATDEKTYPKWMKGEVVDFESGWKTLRGVVARDNFGDKSSSGKVEIIANDDRYFIPGNRVSKTPVVRKTPDGISKPPTPDAKTQEFAAKWDTMGYGGRQDIAQASAYGKQRAVVHRISGSKWSKLSPGEQKTIIEAAGKQGPERKTEVQKPEVPAYGASNKIFTEDKAAKAREILKAKLNGTQLNMGLDPEIISAGIDLAGYHIEAGARTFADYTKAMIDDIGENIRPYLKSFYLAVRNYPGFDKAGMNTETELDTIDENAIDNESKGSKIESGGKGNEHSTDGSAGPGSLEGDKSESLSGDGGGQGPVSGERGGSQVDNEGNGNIDEGRDDERGSLAGEPTPIHLQDGESDSDGVSAGSGRDGESDSLSQESAPASEPRTIKLSGVNPGNYRITETDNIGAGTRGQKIDSNLSAIRLIKQLDKDGRYPTKEEQAILAKYVGWGGLKSVFDKSSTKPQDIRAREELESILTKEEYLEAFVSMTNAHYTSPEVIKSIYKVMKHFGFSGGNVLEPTYGAGNFIGLMPDDLAASSKWYGSELDIITSKIGQYLYPDSQLIQSGFQEAEFPYGKYDAALGNPPFGDERIADTRKSRQEINRFKIHNYVIAKEGMHLRPGGILANVVTTRFLDTVDSEARDFLAKQFKFLGAIRLPNDAFAKNAGTEVTTDIVFFQRLLPGEAPDLTADWLETGATMKNSSGEDVTLNRYFVNNPEMMLGEPSMKGTMYGGSWKDGGKGEFTLDRRDGQAPTDTLIDSILENQFADMKGIMRERADDKADAAAVSLTINKEDVGIGGYYLDGDTVYMRGDDDKYGNPTYSTMTEGMIWSDSLTPNGKGGYTRVVTRDKKKETVIYNSDKEVPASLKLGETRLNRIKGMLKLRELAYDLVNAERFDINGIEDRRKALNSAYDMFVRENGFLSESVNFSLMSDDVKIEFGLETGFKKEITPARAKALGIKPSKASADKATILTERMFYPDKEILYAKNPLDGYNISLSQKGRLDLDYVSGLTGLSHEQVVNDLAADGMIFKDPKTGEWIQEDDYLSGNVKAKYKEVEGKEGFEKNAEALKNVFPPDKPTERIYAQLGSPWIPEKYYKQFGEFIGLTSPHVIIYKETGNFNITAGGMRQNDVNIEWKNDYFSLTDLCEAAANNKSLAAYDGKGDDRVQNKEQTRVISNIVQSVRRTFQDWIYADEMRSKELTKIYNDEQNTNAPRRFDGRHLVTVGSNPAVVLRNTQRNAAWRMIQSAKVLLDHCVGAGKTFTIITGVQERVRMGLSKKAMIVVPNHLVGQWAADYMKLYPGARVLAATKKDFTKQNRRRLFARIAAGKFDAVIVGHSSFGFIPIETESLTSLIMEEIEHLERAHSKANEAGDKRLIKSLAKRIQKKRERIKELVGRPKDNVTTFEGMGIDHLIVDESHEFKNLEYSSAMQNITGMGNPMGSKKAFDLYSKIRWMATQKDSSLTFATGTPISNSLVEMYALFRYMNREALVSRGIDAFDSWAKSYAAIEPKIEYTASQKLKERTIMSTFNNLSEMLQIYNEFSDTVTMDDLKRIYAGQIRERNINTGGNEREEFPIPHVEGGGRVLDVADATDEQSEYVDYLVARAERLEKEGRQADPKIDNHLWIMGDARKMALDIRLVDPSAPDNPNNKINRAARSIKEIFDKTKDVRGTQLVFCDLSTPKGASQKNAASFIRDALKKAHLDGDRAAKIILDSLGSYQEKWGYIRNRLESELDAIADHELAETDQYMRRREDIEEYLDSVTDDVVADLTTADTGFSVYDELRSKLIDMGIPEGEIKFIHDANSDAKKQEVFDLVNAGKIRVLLGSSMKMGAGMNVQERLVALHHMDAPWRPSDVEQREGRIVRQGNQLYEADPEGFKVILKAYSTKNTFDAVMWQILARKGAMLDDFRNGADSVEDTSTDEAGYSDFMAQSTGNPAFKEKFQLEGEIQLLDAVKRRTQTRLRSAQQTINYNKSAREKEQESISRRSGIIDKLKGITTFTYKGKEYKDNAADIVNKTEKEYQEYNSAVDKEYSRAYDEAMKGAFAKAGIQIVEKPRAPFGEKPGSKEWNQYQSDFKNYEEFWSDENNGKIAAEAVKGIKKKQHKHLHYDKLAESDKSGVISVNLEIVERINNSPINGTVSIKMGDVTISFEKTEATGWNKRDDSAAGFDVVVTADGSFIIREENRKKLVEMDVIPLTAGRIREILERHNSGSERGIRQMEAQDDVARDTLEKLKFKDEEKLKAKKERYNSVLQEVQAAEQEIDARRASVANKYITYDKTRFPRGYEPKPQNNHTEPTSSLVEQDIDKIDLDALRTQRMKDNVVLKDWDDDDIAGILFRKRYHDVTGDEQLVIEDRRTLLLASVARAEAILSQKKDGNIRVAEDNLKEARDRWDDWHDGEEYPYEIKLAQRIIMSIKNRQGHLFSGQLYSGLDPTQIVKVLKGLESNIREATPYVEALGRKVYSSGKKNFHEWRDRMRLLLGDLWKNFKDIIQKVWSKLKEERGSFSNIESMPKAEAIKRIERNLKVLNDEAQKAGVSLDGYMRGIGVPDGQITRLMEYAKGLKLPEGYREVKPDEVLPAGSGVKMDVTGVKHAVVDEERIKAGKEPVKKQEPRGNEGMFQAAKAAVDSGEINPRLLAQEVAKKPRPITTEEEFSLMYDRMRIKNELRDIRDNISRAQENKDTQAESDLIERRASLEADLDINDQATTHGGSEVGRSLQARTRMVNEDYSLEEILLRARQDNGGTLTEEMRKKYEAMAKEIEAANAKIKEYEEKVAALEAKRAFQRMKNEDVIIRYLGQAKTKRAESKAALNAEFKDLSRQLNSVLGGLHFNFDPTAIKIMALMARNRIKDGVMSPEDIVNDIYADIHENYPEIEKREIRDAISGYGKTKQLSKDEIDVQLREAKRLMRLISSYEDATAGQVPLRSGMQRDKMSDETRELGRRVRQAMREAGIDWESSLSPEDQWKTALDAVKTRLRNQIHDITKQIETGERTPKKIGIKYDEEAEALRAQRDKLKETLISIEGKPGMSPEQKIKLAMSSVEKSIAEYERRISEKDLAPRKQGSATPETPELKVLRERRDELKDIYKEMQKEATPKKSPEEIALKSYKTRMKNRIEELEGKLEAGDFAQKPKRQTELDDEGLTLKHDLDRAIYRYKDARLKDQLARRNWLQKLGGGIAETANFMRSLKASMDVSAVFRQGLFTVVGHPIVGAKALPAMFKAFKNDKYRFQVEQDILTRKNYKLYQDAGLDLTDIGTDLTVMEETFMSRLAEKVPGVAGSQRAYTTFLNKIRVDTFDLLIKNLVKSEGKHTPEEAKAIATFINESTGRGKVGLKPNTLSGLNTIFFAPRLVASRFQMLAGHSMWGGTNASRKLIAKEYGRFLSGMAIVYLLAQLGDVDIEWDPKSSDFGKIKIGDTRLDPLGGFSQVIVFLSRVFTGKTKTLSGKIKPIRGDNVPYGSGNTADIIWRFIRTKLAPAIGVSIDVLSGKDVVGNKVILFDKDQIKMPKSIADVPKQIGKVSSIPEKTVAPMALVDTYEAMKANGIPEGLALGTLGMLGVGVQTYDKR